jgi:Ser/Thr protein kinase RdoA (MazF antagonist)
VSEIEAARRLGLRAAGGEGDQRFFQLTPDRVLDAVERGGGRRATGSVYALNSLENRVYEVALEEAPPVVVKFYRPGRWSKEALLDEHRFIADLVEAEVPVAAPLPVDESGATLGELDGIFFSVYPKLRARQIEEVDEDGAERLGRLLARLHLVGSRRDAPARPRLEPRAVVEASLALLRASQVLPFDLEPRYEAAARRVLTAAEARWPRDAQRIHGDCHVGNLMWGRPAPGDDETYFLVDFDDFVVGPPAQDLWLVAGGQDEDARRIRAALYEGYSELRALPPGGATAIEALVEPLRGLRILRYAAWIAARWGDPAFPRAFPVYREYNSWQRELLALESLRLDG